MLVLFLVMQFKYGLKSGINPLRIRQSVLQLPSLRIAGELFA
jgi:hypothetical protein